MSLRIVPSTYVNRDEISTGERAPIPLPIHEELPIRFAPAPFSVHSEDSPRRDKSSDSYDTPDESSEPSDHSTLYNYTWILGFSILAIVWTFIYFEKTFSEVEYDEDTDMTAKYAVQIERELEEGLKSSSQIE